MIIQTTGGFAPTCFSGQLVPLGPWCTSSDSPPTSIIDDLTNERRTEIDAESDQLVEKLERWLPPALNQIHDVNLPPSFWRESVGIYLRMVVPVVLRRRNLLVHARNNHTCSSFTQVDVDLESIIPNSRQSLLAIVNSHAWNHAVLSDLSSAIGLTPTAPTSAQVLRGPTQVEPRHLKARPPKTFRRFITSMSNALARRNSTLIVRTMLPRRLETLLAMRHFTLPFIWTDIDIKRRRFDPDLRSMIVEAVPSTDAVEAAVVRTVIKFIPRIFVEDFSAAWIEGEHQLRNFPKVVFTSNLHLASDVFLIWLARAHASGTKIVIAQHGGVHSLCKEIPGDLHAERDLADTYITWGDPTFTSKRTIAGPTLVNVGVSRRRTSEVANGPLLVVLDSTYRYPSVPRGINGSRFEYATFVNQFLENVDPEVVPKVIIRSYRGSELYDDPIDPLIVDRQSHFRDPGIRPIQELFDLSRLVIQTSLGTTLFQSIYQQIPTCILLDDKMSPLSDAATRSFLHLAKSNIYFNNPIDLAQHVNTVFSKSLQWWLGTDVQASVVQFESRMSPRPTRSIQFYDQVLRRATQDFRGLN